LFGIGLHKTRKTLADDSRASYLLFSHMSTTIVLAFLLAAGAVVSLMWLTFAIARQVRRRRLLHNLGVVSEHWLTVHRAER
jgi:hypothetical protein